MLSTKNTLKIINIINKFTAKDDLRDYLNSIYVISTEKETKIFATNGHIAIKAIIPDQLSPVNGENIIFNPTNEKFLAKIEENINSVTYQEGTPLFDAKYLRICASAIEEIAKIITPVNRHATKLIICGNESASLLKFWDKHTSLGIDILIMPCKQ